MAHRLVVDPATGASWQVWAVHPAARSGRAPTVAPFLADGWLAFERSATERATQDGPAEKRRLAPVPPAWSDLSDAELLALLAAARPAAPPTYVRGR
jgi:hypothetical protein